MGQMFLFCCLFRFAEHCIVPGRADSQGDILYCWSLLLPLWQMIVNHCPAVLPDTDSCNLKWFPCQAGAAICQKQEQKLNVRHIFHHCVFSKQFMSLWWMASTSPPTPSLWLSNESFRGWIVLAGTSQRSWCHISNSHQVVWDFEAQYSNPLDQWC